MSGSARGLRLLVLAWGVAALLAARLAHASVAAVVALALAPVLAAAALAWLHGIVRAWRRDTKSR